LYLKEEAEYCDFSQWCGRVVGGFLNTGSIAIGKSAGRATSATTDVADNVNQIVQRNPYISSFITINR
jgi:hypothetical protein